MREVDSWSAALSEEHRIKALSRSEKQALIAIGHEQGFATP